MSNSDAKHEWEVYKTRELALLEPLLTTLGYELEARQPHLGGERHLTGPIGSGRKLLLFGRDRQGNRVVIKASSEPAGIREIEHERVCRSILEKISFAYQTFLSPPELLYTRQSGCVVLVTAFIDQPQSFLERPLQEQFALALKGLQAQESAHATTYRHRKLIRTTFGEMHAADYVAKFRTYADESKPHAALDAAFAFLNAHAETIEQYCGFLTHWDFMPQNIRVSGSDLYLLDHSSLHFGNKYESWARFINFMTLYNPPLADALVQYVRDNRTPEESLSLRLMRVYRLGELIRYYTGWLPRTEGNLHELALARIAFWSDVLHAVLQGTEVAPTRIDEYKRRRDALRTEDEKQRQIGLH